MHTNSHRDLFHRIFLYIWDNSTSFNSMYLYDMVTQIDAHVRNNLCYLICIMHLVSLGAVENRFFKYPQKLLFFHPCAMCPVIPSHKSTMGKSRFDDGFGNEIVKYIQENTPNKKGNLCFHSTLFMK